MRRRGFFYQIALILLGIISVAMYAVFIHREVFPEYRIYQNDYVELQNFRSSYTGEPAPSFTKEVKQIVFLRDDNGPPIIDRCVSCHVALQVPYFSPTQIAYDINGNILRDAEGIPVKIPNENYIWAKLDKEVDKLKTTDKAAADKLEALKTAHVGEQVYDVTKVLSAHPLIGKETRPFEFHPLEEYGCTSCHNGNGRGLTTPKAHGPVFDGQYEPEFMGPKPEFLEKDPENDPPFAYEFNDKPGPDLLFQTTPLFVGALIEAKCVQCHQPSSSAFQSAVQSAERIANYRQKHSNTIQAAYEEEKQALVTLLMLENSIKSDGLSKTESSLQTQAQDYSLFSKDRDRASAQLKFLNQNKDNIEEQIRLKIKTTLGTEALADELQKSITDQSKIEQAIDDFIKKHRSDPNARGSLFVKDAKWNAEHELIKHVRETSTSLQDATQDESFMPAVSSDVDLLTKHYRHGEKAYIEQACYACHRIAGSARGGVGPELTKEGLGYPWFIKESLVWPQADLRTSTMPNYIMDHEEVEDLMTYLLGQTGNNRTISSAAYKAAIQEWEGGRRTSVEKPITPSQIHDLNFGMKVFATEGCAACHRLEGFESNVGFAIEKEKASFKDTYNESAWFSKLFPETVLGSEIVKTVEKNKEEIDRRIVEGVRQNSLLEEIEKEHPGLIESFYANFKFAKRSKKDPDWQKRISRILMIYIQEYGLGRLICPRPNWSGIYRSDQWLMEHFHNPSSHVPHSLMPVFPFDDTKFYALTYMLDKLAIRNRDAVHAIWENNGFNPEQAFEIHCSQCHGEFRAGNGPVALWIYPIPKNLRNAEFLRNLTKKKVIESITHGVKGTPMPPWGEVGTDKPNDAVPVLNAHEIEQIAEWLFSSLPGEHVIKEPQDVPKWQYTPEDVLKELKREGNVLQNNSTPLRSSLFPLSNAQPNVGDVFDVKPNPVPEINEKAYYIKKKFYTPKNIDEGKAFFELNCAICHGPDADGSGLRAGQMIDAKPRMLINLDWINTRDDLRLLRSIKYGVPGTAMTPWGDLTSSLQRLQLVIFIRSLSESREQNVQLASALYQAFAVAKQRVEAVRIKRYPELESRQKNYSELEKKQLEAFSEASKTATELYQKQMDSLAELKEVQKKDQLFTQLQELIDKEFSLYQELGVGLLAQHSNDPIMDNYLELLRLNKDRYEMKDDTLVFHYDNEEKITRLSQELIEELNGKLNEFEQNKALIEKTTPMPERIEQLKTVNAEINSEKKLRDEAIGTFAEAARLRKRQKDLFETIFGK